ncbi:MotA/TolQ/ExbB proton channel family protein [Sphingomonas sp. SUN039]|uniref:MotA/TolQ/ExbB proton channel family protein n=1 Tax=Sphingomonas sp. SUN039 TaxID=2937787 RepID=UPI0021648BEC|nr:MotA/TolQ/ExbB proton channel family protein [Sphingomonas sp. SUN039]UVO52723.1 MotA/TolQ/ExbB proton channel family protein [Sphingomonas sp. SUN039]
MLIQIAAAAAGAAPKGAEYGLLPALRDGGAVTIATFSIMVLMSIGTLFIFFVKLYEQQKVLSQGQKIRASFWNHSSLAEAAAKVEKDTPYRQIVDDGLRAQEQHTLLGDAQDQHDWTLIVMTRAKAAIESKLKGGLSFLATVGSTAPFVGLFGTVMGILSALVKIGAAGQASIDTVAGPVGEALYMTAIGLGVAVPAVLAFNWLQARNKQISEEMTTFVNSVQAWMSSNGAVKPVIARAGAAKPAAAKPAPAKA